MIFNERLKLLRKENHLTQAQVAEALGMPVRSYQRLESDGPKTQYDTLIRIAGYYQISLDWLTGRTNNRILWL